MDGPIHFQPVALALVLSFAPAAIAAQSGSARGDASAKSLLERAAEILASDCEPPEACIERRAVRLAALRAEAIPTLLELLERGTYELPAGDGTTGVRILGDVERRVLVSALGTLPRTDLRFQLETACDPRAPNEARDTALAVLRELGDASDLHLVLRLATADGSDAVDRLLSEPLEAALEGIFARDERSHRLLGALLRDVSPALREPLIRAAGAAPSSEALASLAAELGEFPELDAALLAQVARIAARSEEAADDRVLDRLRPLLESADPHLAQGAALALGRLQDFESVPSLIELLEHPDAGLRQQAHWSLVRISGLRLRPDPERWRIWHREETEWWRERSSRLFEQIRSIDGAEVAQAILEISRRRMFRGELASELTRALVHEDPAILRQVCDALRQLGSRTAVPALIDCLAFPDPGVQEAAFRTLKAITGRDLPPAPEDWRRVYPE